MVAVRATHSFSCTISIFAETPAETLKATIVLIKYSIVYIDILPVLWLFEPPFVLSRWDTATIYECECNRSHIEQGKFRSYGRVWMRWLRGGGRTSRTRSARRAFALWVILSRGPCQRTRSRLLHRTRVLHPPEVQTSTTPIVTTKSTPPFHLHQVRRQRSLLSKTYVLSTTSLARQLA